MSLTAVTIQLCRADRVTGSLAGSGGRGAHGEEVRQAAVGGVALPRATVCAMEITEDDEEDVLIERFGLDPAGPQLDEIRVLLAEQTALGMSANTLVMRLLCVYLFDNGSLGDVMRIWRAKRSGWDSQFSVDVKLLCGAGLAETKAFLAASSDELAAEALEYLVKCENSDFGGFTPAGYSAEQRAYYTPRA
jgi:hypothetical protein